MARYVSEEAERGFAYHLRLFHDSTQRVWDGVKVTGSLGEHSNLRSVVCDYLDDCVEEVEEQELVDVVRSGECDLMLQVWALHYYGKYHLAEFVFRQVRMNRHVRSLVEHIRQAAEASLVSMREAAGRFHRVLEQWQVSVEAMNQAKVQFQTGLQGMDPGSPSGLTLNLRDVPPQTWERLTDRIRGIVNEARDRSHRNPTNPNPPKPET
jgi:hypothetical protein